MIWLPDALARIRGSIFKSRSTRLEKGQVNPALNQRIKINGRYSWTFEQAAYALRQYSINHDDPDGWRISRMLRDADEPLRARLAEAKLHGWIRSRMDMTLAVDPEFADRGPPASETDPSCSALDNPAPGQAGPTTTEPDDPD
ncbi:hypothetical protein [Rhodopseudomonas sp. RCAM05734]|uniref:hypothetical protein n=1 Tax=Rhodopseudomonas sp. RCAM05734 TaxID=3457549 RepID=UPI0040443AD8